MIAFDLFKELYTAIPGEPEFELSFCDFPDEYMIIKYGDRVSFQKCGCEDGSGEIYYPDLDTLSNVVSIDGICLKRDWQKIESLIINSAWNIVLEADAEELIDRYSNI